AERRTEILAGEAIGDVGGKEAHPVAAIIGLALEFEAEEALLRHQLDHRIGQLDLAAGSRILRGDAIEDLRLQDITAGNDEIGRRIFELRLFDHAVNAKAAAEGGADLDHAVAADLVARHLLDGNDIAPGIGIDLHHLLETTWFGMDQHVRQEQREWLVADQLAGAPYGMADAQRLLLAGP